MSRPPLRPPRSLRFGTWPYRPRWLVAPVLDEAAGRDLAELTAEEASWVVEGIAALQGLRAPLAAVPVLTLTAVLDRVGVDGADAEVMWALSTSAVLVLPFYMVAMGVLHLALRRTKDSSRPMASAHPRLVRVAAAAPFLAVLLAGLAGVLLH